MILYDIMLTIDDSIHDEWLEWMKSKHMPKIMKTGCFTEGKMYRVLTPEPEDGTSYSVHFYCRSLEDYERYQIKHAALLQAEQKEKFGSKFAVYRSVMEKA
ncbi:MAG: DUF4286 family protein [Ignavibacteria bacterium]